MKVLVTGDRDWTNRQVIYDALTILPSGSSIVHGAARGADTIAAEIALEFGLGIHLPPTPANRIGGYPADWAHHGKRAGRLRNRDMLLQEHPDEVWAFHNDLWTHSRGTRNMVDQATTARVPVCLFSESDPPRYLNKPLLDG